MAFESLKHVFGKLEHQSTWREWQQFRCLLRCWPEVVGPVVAVHTRPTAIQQGVLKVATSSSAWAQNLTFERQRILEKLRAQSFTNLVDIRFSTARWQGQGQQAQTSDSEPQLALWREHPSRVSSLWEGAAPNRAQDFRGDANQAFQHWAKQMQARSQNLAICPKCHCPTPRGELQRWSVCALCAAQSWKS